MCLYAAMCLSVYQQPRVNVSAGDVYILAVVPSPLKSNSRTIIQIRMRMFAGVHSDGFKMALSGDEEDALHCQWKDAAWRPLETCRGEMNHILLPS